MRITGLGRFASSFAHADAGRLRAVCPDGWLAPPH